MRETGSLKHGIQPFWFWNGAMEDDEMRRQIRQMKEQGLTGFLIHPRQGLEIPYLSEPFFEKVRTAVAAAKECGLEVWLYDEFPYPSGISGGKVTLEHPEYACRELVKTCGDYSAGQTARLYAPWGKLLSARAYRVENGRCLWEDFIDLRDHVGSGYRQDVFQLSGLTQYNKKRYFQGELAQYLYWQVPQGDWRVYVYTETVMKHFKYFEEFIDPLNPAAVRCFLQTTHEQYKKYVGEEFGHTIRGIFTDEVTAFPPFHPWSPLLPGLVREQAGLELTEYLPALSEDMGEITAKIRYAYWNAATEQFIQSWDRQVYGWCEENNLLYIGEKPILRSKELAYTHVPGIDAGHQKFGSRAALAAGKYRANGKIASSAAHFYQKPAALCEAFHSIGWGMTLQDAKWIFDWLTVMGIDWFVTHGAYYTTDGLKKHDAPPSSFYQMPWWNNMHQLSAYVGQLNGFLTGNRRRVSVLLLDPITSTWTETDAALESLNRDFAAFQNALLRAGVDYYIMDPQLFAQGSVRAEAGTARYENCGDSFSLLVLPFMTNLEPCAVKKLQEYAAAGGRVLAAATLPYRDVEGFEYALWAAAAFGADPAAACRAYFAGESATLPAAQNGGCRFVPDWRQAVPELALADRATRKWQVRAQGGDLAQIESTGPDGAEKLFLANLGPQSCLAEISIGEKQAVRRLAGGESLFLEQQTLLAPEPAQYPTLTLDTREILPCRALSANALRIGNWQLCLPDGQTAAVDSFPLIDQFEAAGIRIGVCQKDFFGCPKELSFPPVQARYLYRFRSELPHGTRVQLVMEPETLLGNWLLRLGGREIGPADFKNTPVYLPSNLAVDVTDALCQGENCLELELQSDQSFGGIRNPLYLCGPFSVALQGRGAVLEPALAQGPMGCLAACGLPYYAGTVEFTRQIPPELRQQALESGGLRVQLGDETFHQALRLKIGQKQLAACAYAPYTFELPAAELQAGAPLTVAVDTALDRLFEGEYFDDPAHAYRGVETEQAAFCR